MVDAVPIAELNQLIQLAMRSNPNLQAAQASLRQANENLAAQRGALYPSVAATDQAERASLGGAIWPAASRLGVSETLNSASVNVSYDARRLRWRPARDRVKQAQAEYAPFALEASYLTAHCQCGHGRDRGASPRAQLLPPKYISRAQQKQLDITELRVVAGAASRAGTLAAAASDPASDSGDLASVAHRSRTAAQSLFRPMRDPWPETTPVADSSRFPQLPIALPVSRPSKFVDQRPDVREYSGLLDQATARSASRRPICCRS